ncbi:MAG TPA: hypothetical protein VH475_15185 [Tepidisphaeraceae bacterium]
MVEQMVTSGRFASAEEAVHAALAALMQQESLAKIPTEEFEAMFPGFREKIAEGLADLKAGRCQDGEAFFDELEREDQEQAARPGRKTA